MPNTFTGWMHVMSHCQCVAHQLMDVDHRASFLSSCPGLPQGNPDDQVVYVPSTAHPLARQDSNVRPPPSYATRGKNVRVPGAPRAKIVGRKQIGGTAIGAYFEPVVPNASTFKVKVKRQRNKLLTVKLNSRSESRQQKVYQLSSGAKSSRKEIGFKPVAAEHTPRPRTSDPKSSAYSRPNAQVDLILQSPTNPDEAINTGGEQPRSGFTPYDLVVLERGGVSSVDADRCTTTTLSYMQCSQICESDGHLCDI